MRAIAGLSLGLDLGQIGLSMRHSITQVRVSDDLRSKTPNLGFINEDLKLHLLEVSINCLT